MKRKKQNETKGKKRSKRNKAKSILKQNVGGKKPLFIFALKRNKGSESKQKKNTEAK